MRPINYSGNLKGAHNDGIKNNDKNSAASSPNNAAESSKLGGLSIGVKGTGLVSKAAGTVAAPFSAKSRQLNGLRVTRIKNNNVARTAASNIAAASSPSTNFVNGDGSATASGRFNRFDAARTGKRFINKRRPFANAAENKGKSEVTSSFQGASIGASRSRVASRRNNIGLVASNVNHRSSDAVQGTSILNSGSEVTIPKKKKAVSFAPFTQVFDIASNNYDDVEEEPKRKGGILGFFDNLAAKGAKKSAVDEFTVSIDDEAKTNLERFPVGGYYSERANFDGGEGKE